MGKTGAREEDQETHTPHKYTRRVTGTHGRALEIGVTCYNYIRSAMTRAENKNRNRSRTVTLPQEADRIIPTTLFPVVFLLSGSFV